MKRALEVIAYTSNPQQQFLRADMGTHYEYHGAYTPTGGTPEEQANEICSFFKAQMDRHCLGVDNMLAGRTFAADDVDIVALMEAQRNEFGTDNLPQTQLRAKPCEPGARVAYQMEFAKDKEVEITLEPIMDGLQVRVGTNMVYDDMGKMYLRGIKSDDVYEEGIAEQAAAMYAQQEKLLRGEGYSYADVSRAHIFLTEMSRDYGDFNPVRNKFFTDNRIVKYPASTGIGIGTFPIGALCVSDVIAHKGIVPDFKGSLIQDDTIDYNIGLGYKVKFARIGLSDRAYVSGHASIIGGETIHLGDFKKQQRQTSVAGDIVLLPHGMNLDDALTSIVYIRNPSDYKAFLSERANWMTFPSPQVVVEAWVCRDDLLFEQEGEFILSAKRMVDDTPVDRRKSILDFNYIPKEIEERFAEHLANCRVIHRAA